MTNFTLEQRVIELETKIAFQEDMLEELNQIVSTQQQELMQYQLLLGELMKKLNSLSVSNLTKVSEQEIPPHY